MITTEFLQLQIKWFCSHHKLTHTEFGKQAVGNGSFYGDLKRGSDIKLGTLKRVNEFMQSYGKE